MLCLSFLNRCPNDFKLLLVDLETLTSTMGFPGGSAGKESTCNVRNLGSTPGLGRFPGEGYSYPLKYSGLENSMDCIVHGVAKSQTPYIEINSIMDPIPKWKM